MQRLTRVMMLLVMVLVLGSVVTYAMELVPVSQLQVTGAKSSVRGMALSQDDSVLYVAGMNEKSVIKVNLANNEITRTSLAEMGSAVSPKGLCVDANGRVWAPLTAPVVAVLSADLQIETVYDFSQFGLATVEGVAVSPTGDIYVTNRNKVNPGIFKFRVQDGQIAPVMSWGINGNVPVSGELRVPVFTPSGDLLVTSWTAGKIDLVRAADGQVTPLIQGKSTFLLDVDGAGNIYVVHYDQKDPALSAYKSDGTLIRTWSLVQLGVASQASTVAVTNDGKRLYVLDQAGKTGGTVLTFDIVQ